MTRDHLPILDVTPHTIVRVRGRGEGSFEYSTEFCRKAIYGLGGLMGYVKCRWDDPCKQIVNPNLFSDAK